MRLSLRNILLIHYAKKFQIEHVNFKDLKNELDSSDGDDCNIENCCPIGVLTTVKDNESFEYNKTRKFGLLVLHGILTDRADIDSLDCMTVTDYSVVPNTKSKFETYYTE